MECSRSSTTAIFTPSYSRFPSSCLNIRCQHSHAGIKAYGLRSRGESKQQSDTGDSEEAATVSIMCCCSYSKSDDASCRVVAKCTCTIHLLVVQQNPPQEPHFGEAQDCSSRTGRLVPTTRRKRYSMSNSPVFRLCATSMVYVTCLCVCTYMFSLLCVTVVSGDGWHGPRL